jgi:hypothetical protein
VDRPARVAALALVAEGDALEAHLADDARGAQLDRILGLDDVDRQVDVLEDPVEQRERGLDIGLVWSVVKATTVPSEIGPMNR